MKAVILAGGFGTRISEESAVRPKPMVEIGGKPILWHIMKTYAFHGVRDFVVCTGYKGHVIREYFANYWLNATDVTFDLGANSTTPHSSRVEPWKVTVLDTGIDTMTGGRLLRARDHIGDEPFCVTYGDCLSSIDISSLVDFHRATDAVGTLTAIQPPGRFGALELEGDAVSTFHEKPDGDGGWVNGGFFVFDPAVFEYIEGDDTVLERGPLETLASLGRLKAYRHSGYWQNLDSLRDKTILEQEWVSDTPGWKVW